MIELVRIEGTCDRADAIVLERSDGGESTTPLIVQIIYLVLILYTQSFE
jgi:hypothetical protein